MGHEFFDEMMECLQRTGEARRAVPVSEDVLQAFFSGSAAPAGAKAAVKSTPPAPVSRPRPAPVAPAVPAPPPAPAPVLRASRDVSALNWEELENCALNCQECRLCERRHNVVFGEGDRNARLMFIGEGPGAEEDAQGRPFVGEAGVLLTKMIQAMQFTRESVYIANIVKCRPPGNRNPADDEAAACLKYLKRQIALIAPDAIVTLGAVPLRFLLETDGITRSRGKWRDYRGIPVMPTFHPAYLLRNAAAKREVWADLQQVMARFGKAHHAGR